MIASHCASARPRVNGKTCTADPPLLRWFTHVRRSSAMELIGAKAFAACGSSDRRPIRRPCHAADRPDADDGGRERGRGAANVDRRPRSQVEPRRASSPREAGIHVVLTPERAPNANAYAERFVRSIKEECLDRMIPIGERHFRRAIAEYVEHYHRERNHQGLDNRLIAGTPVIESTSRVRCRPRLGGLLNFYERAA